MWAAVNYAYSIALLAAFGSQYHSRANRQRIGDQIDAAMTFARADFVNVHYGEGGLFRRRAFTNQMIERTKHNAKYGVRMYSQDFRPAPLYRSRNMSPGVSYLYGIALTPSSWM